MATQIRGGKKKFVADGVFYAVLNAILTKELAEYGDSGAEVRVTKKEEVVTEIPKKEETSPATGGSVAGVREKVSPKTKQ